MSPLTRPILTALLVTALVGLAGCGDSSDDPSTTATDSTTGSSATSSPSADATPSKEATPPTSARTDFCSQIPMSAVKTALDAASVYDETWKPGTDAEVMGGAHDPASEWGCEWTAKDGTSVTAWLFATPVTPQDATKLVKQATDGCEKQKVAPHGDPTVTVQCINDDDTVTRTQALFGDAWLSCSLQTPGILTRLDRAGDWCAAVREAALV